MVVVYPSQALATVPAGSSVTEILAAIATISFQGGGTVQLQAGTFNLTDNLVLPSNVHLVGVGSVGTTLDFGGGAFQIQIIGTAMTTVDSVFLGGFTVQNSSVALINADYVFNLGGNDIQSINGLTGLTVNHCDTLNWNIGFVDTCGTGIVVSNTTAMTITNTFLTNITSGGGYVCNTVDNSIIFDSSANTVVGNGYDCTAVTDFGINEFSLVNITGHGILLDSCGLNFGISQGLCDTCSGDGLRFRNSTTQVQVAGGVQASNCGGWGINITDAGSTNNLFVGNSFFNNTSGNVTDAGSNVFVGNIGYLTGASGSFTTTDLKTVTVTNGIITSIV